MSVSFPYTASRPLRIGTRQSPLALKQAEMVTDAIRDTYCVEAERIRLVPMTASGDRVQDRALAEIGGKALWTKELDIALVQGEIDCAVHSMKDVETIRPAQFVLPAMLKRADVRDRLIGAPSLDALQKGARFGTASPRRTAQLLRVRPDLDIGLIRGNVATRLARIDSGEFDATILAAAGLERLGHATLGSPLPIEDLLPAPSQGAIGIECLADNDGLVAMLAAIDDEPTSRCVLVERAFLAALGADCRSPVAAHATPDGAGYSFRAQLYSSDGADMVEGECGAASGSVEPAAALARRLLDGAPDSVSQLFPG